MTARRAAVATETCPACGHEPMRAAPASRVTGYVIQDCRRCGLHTLLGREAIMAAMPELTPPDRDSYAAYMAVTRKDVLTGSYHEVLGRLGERDGGAGVLFDVGAGDADFLAVARDHGYEPHGNEITPGAVELAAERHGVDLLLGDLSEHPDAGPYDVVTMWCVLAHVADGSALLREVRRVLADGGTLFVQTPRWSSMDRIGMALHRLSRGRLTLVTDRRMASHHMTLHSRRSIVALLRRCGFTDVEATPRARYSLSTVTYLESLKVAAGLARRIGSVLDPAINRGWFFRNVLDVYARRAG